MYDNIERLDGTNEDDLLLEKFIGKKYDIFRSKAFNWPAFFFGDLYFYFRKMLGKGLIFFLIRSICIFGLGFFLLKALSTNQINGTFLTIVIAVFVLVLSIIISVVIALLTNKIYMRFARKKVLKIQDKYIGKDLDEIASICEKKGGTSILMTLLGIFIIGAFFGIIMYLATLVMNPFLEKSRKNFEEVNENIVDQNEEIDEQEYDEEEKLNDTFSFIIPDAFEEGIFNSESKLDYYYDEDPNKEDECSFMFEKNSDYGSIEEFFNDVIYDDNLIIDEEQTINNINWSLLSITTDYGNVFYYATTQNEKLYVFTYEIENEAPEVCKKYMDDIVNNISLNVLQASVDY